MTRLFKNIPANPTFGTLTKLGYQSDYISNKKLIYCIILYNCDKKFVIN